MKILKYAIILLVSFFSVFNWCVVWSQVSLDPTRPPYYRDVKKEGFRKIDLAVQGITVDKTRRVAIVNDKVLHVGDEISGVKVIAINKNSVEFQNYEGRFSILMHESMVKEIKK